VVENKTWTTIDKTGWGDGPWQAEPDKEQWTDKATGLPCLIKRNDLGALCGYVGVPEGHPWFGKDYDDIQAADVHGGLTYAGICQEGPEDKTICHIPAPGEPDQMWWLGFDCNHCMDIAPGMKAHMTAIGLGQSLYPFGECYRTISYVKAECARLAEQAAAAVA